MTVSKMINGQRYTILPDVRKEIASMTKEEAIARIEDHIVVHGYREQHAVKILEALNMAIKALEESEPTGWMPDSKPPTENGPYLVYMPFAPEGHHITVADWCGSYWNIKTPITKWVRLPEP